MNIHEEHSQMVKQLAKSGESILATVTPVQMHRLHMAIGIAGEVGEVTDLIQQVSKYEISEVDFLENFKEEIGDLLFYFVGYAQTLDEVLLEEYARFEDVSEEVFIKLVIASSDLLDATKRDAIYQKGNVEEKITKAMKDVYKNLKYMMDMFQVTVEQAKEHNLNKLLKGKNARYASGSYSDQQANDRADKQGE